MQIVPHPLSQSNHQVETAERAKIMGHPIRNET